MDEATLRTELTALLAGYRQQQPEFPEVSIASRGMRHEGNWWYVPVVNLGPPSDRVYPYYDHLNAVEALVKRRLDIDVLFVPARAA